MKRFILFAVLAIPLMLLVNGCSDTVTDNKVILEKTGNNSGNIIVANRASGTISVINSLTDEVTGTFSLPGNNAEPMYVVFTRQGQRVFVGDRANSQVVVFRSSDFSVETTIPVGNGVFHMWADPQGKQLWVNSDIDKNTSVIDLHTLQVIAVIPTPADLVADGGIPHDVILDPNRDFAYLSVLGLSGVSDYVVQFSTTTFEETGRAAVGKDPHLSLSVNNRFLFVPCQNSNAVYVINRNNMSVAEIINVPGAHGAGMPVNGKTFYTTNLTGGGTNGLYAISTRNNSIIGSTDTPYPVPHNIAMLPSAKKIYVTHSGAASDKVTVYEVSNRNPVPVFLTEITVGLNPFGLSFSH
jgi:DNA-binding beta-propeller fold protein YncE